MNVRAPEDADLPDVLALLQAADVELIGESDWTEQELREEWEDADLERDAWLVELDGRLAGYALLIDRGGGRLNADGYVDPGAPRPRRRAASCSGSRRSGRARWPTERSNGRVLLHNATLTADPTVPALYDRHGYEPARHFFRMVIDLERPAARSRPGPRASRSSRTTTRARRAPSTRPSQEAFAGRMGLPARDLRGVRAAEARRRALRPGALVRRARRTARSSARSLCDWKRMGRLGLDRLGRRARARGGGAGIGEALLRGVVSRVPPPRRAAGRARRRRRRTRRARRGSTSASACASFWEAVVYEKELRG